MSLRSHLEVTMALDHLLERSRSFVIVHSALHRVAIDSKNARWPLLRCFKHWASEGRTILFPTFTFDFTSSGVFDRANPSSDTGLLGKWVLDLDIAIRTDHPIYSFAVIGPESERVRACNVRECFGSGSLLSNLVEWGMTVIMLGAKWDNCTLFHCLEEEARVPYRFYKTFAGKSIDRDSWLEVETEMYVRDKSIQVENNFSKLIDRLDQGIEKAPRVESIQGIDADIIFEVGREVLDEDKFALVKDPSRIRYCCDMRENRRQNTSATVYLYSADNVHFLGSRLQQYIVSSELPREIVIHCPEFGQQEITLLKKEISPDFIFVVERLHTVLFAQASEKEGDEDLSEMMSVFLRKITTLCELGAQVIVCGFDQPNLPDALKIESRFRKDMLSIVSDCNRMLLDFAEEAGPNVVILPISFGGFDQEESSKALQAYYLSKCPYSAKHLENIAVAAMRVIVGRLGLSIRLLVVDLDNTLWGGVLGEDGIEGIQLGGDFPGSAFMDFQSVLKNLMDKGIALAICSKNDEESVLELFNNHPEMRLTLDDFVSYRINWQDKAKNIESIASEMGLGLASIGFVDDNPIETTKVRVQCPEVKVIDLGPDPALFSKKLLESFFLAHESLTPEDRKRVRSYRARSRIIAEKRSAASLPDFFQRLAVRVFIQSLNKFNTTRAVQLVQKTNQFNSTCRRYTEAELSGFPGEVLVIGADDSFHERENIGLLLIQTSADRHEAVIELFLLSCRALGKGIEQQLVIWVTAELKNRGITKIRWAFEEHSRNKIVAKLMESSGFEREGMKYFSGPLSSDVNPENQFVLIIDERDQTDHNLSRATL